MHICILVKNYASGKVYDKSGMPNKSGAEFHAENHALQFAQYGHKVTIMTKKQYVFTKSRENINGIDVVRLHGGLRWIEIILRLFFTHSDIDAFYILGVPRFAVWAVLYGIFRGKKSTLVLTGEAEIFDGKTNWRNKIFCNCDSFVAISQKIRKGLISYGRIDDNKIIVLPQGVDCKKFAVPTNLERLQLRKKHQISSTAKVLIFCARITKAKGIDTLEKAWSRVHANNKDAMLIIVGGGYTDIIKKLKIFNQQVNNTIRIIGEITNVSEFYQLADVYIHPSRIEGLPTTLMEAMSCGLPAVVSDIGGCEDLVFNKVNGYRIKAEDWEGFANAVLSLFAHEDIRALYGNNARKHIERNCSYDVIMPKWIEVLKNGKCDN